MRGLGVGVWGCVCVTCVYPCVFVACVCVFVFTSHFMCTQNMHDFDEARYLSGPRLLTDPPNKGAVKDFIDVSHRVCVAGFAHVAATLVYVCHSNWSPPKHW